MAKPSGGVGRPSKRYTTTDDQVHLEVDVRQDDILVALLGRALKMLPAEVAEEMAEEVGLGTARRWPRRSSRRRPIDRSKERCTRSPMPFRPTASPRAEHADEDEELQIVAEHCPFGDAVVEHPVICAVDRGIVKGMLAHMIGSTPAPTPLRRSPRATTSASPTSRCSRRHERGERSTRTAILPGRDLHLVRHAAAGDRSRWDGDDLERPTRRARPPSGGVLADFFADTPIRAVWSSMATRCSQTVAPLAARHERPVELRRELTEGHDRTICWS